VPAFEYRALDGSGDTRRGLLEADSERHARRVLREQQLVPLTVSAGRRTGHGEWGRRRALNGEQLALFTRLLGTLLKSGLALDDALTLLARQAGGQQIERIVLDVRARVLEGHTLEQALAAHDRSFPEVFRATIGAGERSRHLPLVLTELAGYIEARERLRQRVRLALLYPAVLCVTALLVVAGLLTYVVPEVVKVFADVGQRLPWATRALIAASEAARHHGLTALGLGAAAVWTMRRLCRRPAPRRALHALVLGLPVLGPLILQTEYGKFARTLGILLGGGVDMLDALTISAKAVPWLPLRDGLTEVVTQVREGAALGHALRETGRVPPLLSHLVTSGEQSGDLPRMLETAAEAFDQKTASALGFALGLFEPLLIFTMGALVLFVVVAILLPIFEMNQLV
jgi:general secretion pathway protein F